MVVAVDVGGTNLRAGRLDEDNILVQRSVPLTDKDVLDKTIEQLAALIKSVMTPDVTGIGIGVPSVVDADGVVTDVTNIPSWKRVELKKILEARFNVPVYVNNDVNCFILGEHRYGVVKGFRSVVGLAMGTGLGGGVVIDNRLYTGNNCGAGEFGMIPYLDANLEAYCSGWFFKNQCSFSALEAFHRAGEGDREALESWKVFGKHIGNALKMVIYTFDPEAVVLGGSLANAYPFFNKAMIDSVSDIVFPDSLKKLKIFISENSNIALLGAASLIP